VRRRATLPRRAGADGDKQPIAGWDRGRLRLRRALVGCAPVRRVPWTRQLRGEVIFFSDSWPRRNI
jgi:hypothetical protein